MSESPAVAHLCVARFCCVVIAPWACGVFLLPQILTPKVRTQGNLPELLWFVLCILLRDHASLVRLAHAPSATFHLRGYKFSLFSLSLLLFFLLIIPNCILTKPSLFIQPQQQPTTITTTTNGKSFSTASQSLHSSEHGRHPLHFANACHRRSTRCSCAQRDGVATGQTLR